MLGLRSILLCLLMLAVAVQGYAASTITYCGPELLQPAASVAHDHASHDHASPQGAGHHGDKDSGADLHAAQDGTSHKCGNCAPCHSIGMTPTPRKSVPPDLPRGDLAEPLYVLALVSPSVPRKPPRA